MQSPCCASASRCVRKLHRAIGAHVLSTTSMLGGAVLLDKLKQLQATDAAAATAKLTEAEPLLVQGYEGMQQGAMPRFRPRVGSA